jgi:peptidoglycan hydrolase CwlO-like protein
MNKRIIIVLTALVIMISLSSCISKKKCATYNDVSKAKNEKIDQRNI